MDIIENNEIAQNNEIKIIKGDEIDLIALIKSIWNERKTIIYTTIAIIVIGLMIAIFSPVKYSASSVILPQVEDNNIMNNIGGGLGALAGLAGVNLSSMMGNNSSITPDLYPDIISSYPFLNELLENSFYFEKEAKTITLYDKLYADTISGFGSKILQYTILLPWTVKKMLSKKNEKQDIPQSVVNNGSKLIIMDERLDEILKAASEMIYVEVDEKTGLINVGATIEKEPVAAAQLAQKVVDLLQKYIISNKTKQAQENLDFIEFRYLEQKKEFESIQKEFLEYRDAHRNLVPERISFRMQELNDAYNVAMNVSISLAQQLEQAKIAVKKETPVFSIIEPVKIPFERSSPARTKIMIVSVFLGGFLGIIVSLCKIFWKKIKRAWKGEYDEDKFDNM